jgi:hypothetical protein
MNDQGGHDDEAILSRVRSLFEVTDPMPADLVDQVRFTVALAGLEAEVAELTTAASSEPALARGTPEEIRTITFDSRALTIMIRIDSNADGTARVDGWLAPPRCCQVEIAIMGESVTARADEDGRFAFPSVPRGTVRFVVRPPDREDDQHTTRPKTVITPALVLLTAR